MLPVGSFLVFGPESAPVVHLLTADEHKLFLNRRALATKHGSDRVYKDIHLTTFGQANALYALPCSNYDCMIDIATKYEGPYAVEIRGIAAAIALGKPFSKDSPNDQPPKSDEDGGGPKVPRKPAPKGKPPSALAQLLQG